MPKLRVAAPSKAVFPRCDNPRPCLGSWRKGDQPGVLSSNANRLPSPHAVQILSIRRTGTQSCIILSTRTPSSM